jgi:hypothetical protein
MSPEQLCKNNSEHGHQAALFAWANMALNYGFADANNMNSYRAGAGLVNKPHVGGVSALRWLHAIPNGGNRDPRTAAMLKAEGVKPGIADVFLPIARGMWHGLYIELKRLDHYAVSDVQREFQNHCLHAGYRHELAIGWRDAAKAVENYL